MSDLSVDQKILEIEKEIRETPYHKGTEHHIGKLKARLVKIKAEESDRIERSKGGSGGGGYFIKKTGDATIIFIGPPSVGKSTLLNKITHAQSKIGAYDFTTINVIPGMMEYKGAKIQIFDVPGIVEGAAKGKGRGREVLSVARSSNLVVIMVDVKTLGLIQTIGEELYENGIRLDEDRPKVTILKQPSGGIKVNSTTQLDISHDTIRSLALDFRMPNAEITIKENITMDRLIDSFANNRLYLPFLVVINKIDIANEKEVLKKIPSWVKPVMISAENNINIDLLKEKIWESLNFIRIYLKKRDEVDYNSPVIVNKGDDLFKILEKLFIQDKENFKYAKVFGPGSKYPGQEVSLTFVPVDETVVQFED